MRKTSITLMVASIAALLLSACTSGSFESNKAPVANAGGPLTVNVGQLVTLDGTASSDPNDNIALYQWTQIAGTAVTLSAADTARPSFTVPQLTVGATLTFKLVITDSGGLVSTPATVTATVSDVTTIAITGTVRFERVPFRTSPYRLDYANPVLLPARGVVVRAITPGTLAVVAATITSDTGEYSLTVATNTTIIIQAEARLLREGALPNWNVRVQNGTSAAAPYRVASAPFNSSASVQNIDIRANINSSGTATGTRASGPFAILDTLYKAVQTTLTVMPTANLPALYVDWGTSDQGAFFDGLAISLRSDLTEDTDEFDESVIAHEFGHYLQRYYSRSDSSGGAHGVGDQLEPSMAFDEGFATAFGAIVLNNPLYLDSYVDNAVLRAFDFNVELNPPDSPGEGPGCWCSESTVWSLAWDLYDSTNDGSDNIALGFAPLWQALTSDHRVTPALTSIFSFIAALKANRPADAAAIDALVLAQNIGPVANAFAAGETHAPLSGLLPVFADITVGGGAVVLRTTDDAGRYNKVGNHRFLKFVAPTPSGTYTFRVTTSNPNASDPDFKIFRSGLTVVDAESDPSPSGETAQFAPIAGATYVIDAYDCANGCDTAQGTPGDYDLTVTIN